MYTEEDLKQLAVEMDQIQYCDVTTAKQLVAEVIRLREALEEISESWMCTARRDKTGKYTLPPLCREIADSALSNPGHISR